MAKTKANKNTKKATSSKKKAAKKVTKKAVSKKKTNKKATSAKKVVAKKTTVKKKTVAKKATEKGAAKKVSSKKTETKKVITKKSTAKKQEKVITAPMVAKTSKMITPSKKPKESVLKKVVNKAKKTLKDVSAKSLKKADGKLKIISNEAKPIVKEVKKVNQVDVIKDVVNILNSTIGNRSKEESTAECPNCLEDTGCRRREFSEQALTVLLLWGEIRPDAVDLPICDCCYDDMREVLIDRAEEIEHALQGEDVFKVREIVAKVAS